jgi:hypothetical protein
MIDIWLIFAQLVPFAEVLLHTWMDSLRVSEDREVNHHGTSVKVEGTQNTEEKVFKFNVVNRKVKNLNHILFKKLIHRMISLHKFISSFLGNLFYVYQVSSCFYNPICSGFEYYTGPSSNNNRC